MLEWLKWLLKNLMYQYTVRNYRNNRNGLNENKRKAQVTEGAEMAVIREIML